MQLNFELRTFCTVMNIQHEKNMTTIWEQDWIDCSRFKFQYLFAFIAEIVRFHSHISIGPIFGSAVILENL